MEFKFLFPEHFRCDAVEEPYCRLCALNALLYVALYALSNLDGYMTLFCLEWGYCSEVNPLMRYLIELSPDFFLFIKNLLVGLFGGLLFMFSVSKQPEWQRKGTFLLFTFVFIYAAVVVQHTLHLL